MSVLTPEDSAGEQRKPSSPFHQTVRWVPLMPLRAQAGVVLSTLHKTQGVGEMSLL